MRQKKLSDYAKALTDFLLEIRYDVLTIWFLPQDEELDLRARFRNLDNLRKEVWRKLIREIFGA